MVTIVSSTYPMSTDHKAQFGDYLASKRKHFGLAHTGASKATGYPLCSVGLLLKDYEDVHQMSNNTVAHGI